MEEELLESIEKINELSMEAESMYFLFILTQRALQLKLSKEELVQCVEVALYLELTPQDLEVEELCRENVHRDSIDNEDIDLFIKSVLEEGTSKSISIDRTRDKKYHYRYVIKRDKTQVKIKLAYKDGLGDKHTENKTFGVIHER